MTYKHTDFRDDEVIVYGFAHGGLTEVPRARLTTANLAPLLAAEHGMCVSFFFFFRFETGGDVDHSSAGGEPNLT